MNILITGATGFIGDQLLRSLRDAGHQVTACVRRPDQFTRHMSGVKALHCDFSKDHSPNDWLPRLENIDVVINTVGIIRQQGKQSFTALHRDTPIALFRACEQQQVKKVIQISALGADAQAQSEYHLTKKAADDVLSTLQLDWLILRPSIVYGPRAQSMALFRAMAALPVIPLMDKGEQAIQPIHIDDLVRIVQILLKEDAPERQYLDLVGPEPITMGKLFSQLRQWLGLASAHFIRIPWGLSLFMAKLTGLMGNTPLNTETVQMLKRGNTANVTDLIKQVHFKPASLTETLAASPCTTADLWYARLYFLLPVLRLSIALLWIGTGIISAFIYPVAESYQLLERMQISGWLAAVALYGGAAIDLVLGLAMLINYRIKLVGILQILIVTVYTVLISLALPEFWQHPFGPITKNIPLLIATLVVIATAEKR